MPTDTEREEHYQRQREQSAEQSAMNASTSAAQQQIQKRVQNPQFFAQLRDIDFPQSGEEYDWLEGELGPETSGAHLVGNRSAEYEQWLQWGNKNKAKRMQTEGTPGRLCKGSTLAIAQGVHRRTDKDRRDAYTRDEKRAIRSAYEAVTNYQALAVGARGLRSVTQATAVSKIEKEDSSDQSLRERAGKALGGF
jgi:hypothetical protein